jgi:hypothetical protein
MKLFCISMWRRLSVLTFLVSTQLWAFEVGDYLMIRDTGQVAIFRGSNPEGQVFLIKSDCRFLDYFKDDCLAAVLDQGDVRPLTFLESQPHRRKGSSTKYPSFLNRPSKYEVVKVPETGLVAVVLRVDMDGRVTLVDHTSNFTDPDSSKAKIVAFAELDDLVRVSENERIKYGDQIWRL